MTPSASAQTPLITFTKPKSVTYPTVVIGLSSVLPTNKVIKQKSGVVFTLKRGSAGIAVLQIIRSTGEKSTVRAAIVKKSGNSQLPVIYFKMTGKFSISIKTDAGQSVALVTVR